MNLEEKKKMLVSRIIKMKNYISNESKTIDKIDNFETVFWLGEILTLTQKGDEQEVLNVQASFNDFVWDVFLTQYDTKKDHKKDIPQDVKE